MGIEFLNLGKQPLANGFLTPEEFDNEFFFELRAHFEPKTYLVSIDSIPPEKMFNEHYAYTSSCSNTMIEHFKSAAECIKEHAFYTSNFNVLEIGSNDGIFVKHFDPQRTICVEPCSNFAEQTRKMGYTTYDEFWTTDLAESILKKHGKQFVIYSANCMCHIQDIQQAFHAVSLLLDDDGYFIFEDPSMLEVIKNDSYDQIYDEHAHLFSLIALKQLLENAGLYICIVDKLSTHGGSNRIYAQKKQIEYLGVDKLLDIEYGYGLHKLGTYFDFAHRVQESKKQLVNLVRDIRKNYEHIFGYGATSKSTVVYNYCGFGPGDIDFIIDTTPYKQGKFSPGTHIPIVPPQDTGFIEYAFLGAWNYKDEICAKEKNRKFKFITHVPKVYTL